MKHLDLGAQRSRAIHGHHGLDPCGIALPMFRDTQHEKRGSHTSAESRLGDHRPVLPVKAQEPTWYGPCLQPKTFVKKGWVVEVEAQVWGPGQGG